MVLQGQKRLPASQMESRKVGCRLHKMAVLFPACGWKTAEKEGAFSKGTLKAIPNGKAEQRYKGFGCDAANQCLECRKNLYCVGSKQKTAQCDVGQKESHVPVLLTDTDKTV